jgi:hypothetical protein
MSDQPSGRLRVRYSLTGALAALAVVGAIAGTAALAANSRARPHRHARQQHATITNGSKIKTPTSPAPGKTGAPQPAVNHQPFLNAIGQLVDKGTITAVQGQTVDSEIQAGRVDSDTLAASGAFTPSQIQAVQQTLSNAKRVLGPPAPPAAGKNPAPQQNAKAHHS